MVSACGGSFGPSLGGPRPLADTKVRGGSKMLHDKGPPK